MNNQLPAVRAWVINLDRSVQRLEHIRQRLDELQIPWERVPAVNGAELDLSLDQRLDTAAFGARHGKPPLPGELGCYLSHVKAMDLFLASSDGYALILEDDVELGSSLPAVMDQLVMHPKHWDLIKLSGIHSGHPLRIQRLNDGHHAIAVSTTSYTGASCYLVNRRAAAALLQALLPMKIPYDLAYDRGWEMGIKIRMVTPAPCNHSFAMGSELHPKGVVRQNFHWTKRLSTYRWRIGNDCRRLLYGLSEYAKEALSKKL